MSLIQHWDIDSEIEKEKKRLPVFVNITNSKTSNQRYTSNNIKNQITTVLNVDAKPFVPSNNKKDL